MKPRFLIPFFTFNRNPRRFNNLVTTCKHILDSGYVPSLFTLGLCSEEIETLLQLGVHIPYRSPYIPGTTPVIWYKEILQNLANTYQLRGDCPADFYIHVDADCVPKNGWPDIIDAYSKIISSGCYIFQGFGTCTHADVEKSGSFLALLDMLDSPQTSYAFSKLATLTSSHAPGGCWVFHKSVLPWGDLFFPLCLSGGGDSFTFYILASIFWRLSNSDAPQTIDAPSRWTSKLINQTNLEALKLLDRAVGDYSGNFYLESPRKYYDYRPQVMEALSEVHLEFLPDSASPKLYHVRQEFFRDLDITALRCRDSGKLEGPLPYNEVNSLVRECYWDESCKHLGFYKHLLEQYLT